MTNSFPQRKENRLKQFDYGSFGYYFVTICTKNKECFFWQNKPHVGVDIIRPHSEHLLKNGIIVNETIKNIEKHYENVGNGLDHSEIKAQKIKIQNNFAFCIINYELHERVI